MISCKYRTTIIISFNWKKYTVICLYVYMFMRERESFVAFDIAGISYKTIWTLAEEISFVFRITAGPVLTRRTLTGICLF